MTPLQETLEQLKKNGYIKRVRAKSKTIEKALNPLCFKT